MSTKSERLDRAAQRLALLDVEGRLVQYVADAPASVAERVRVRGGARLFWAIPAEPDGSEFQGCILVRERKASGHLERVTPYPTEPASGYRWAAA